MKNQGYNPFLPLDEYIPDGEPHVFGDRVYLYGSHDAEGGTRFCERDYTVYSAAVDDLGSWTCHGTSYQRSQDPRSRAGRLVDLYAPDCVRGNDGRFYLNYCAMGPNVKNFGPMSVAVSDHPEGPFAYLGDIRYADGMPMTKFLTNDPAVLNDNGRIWLYYGWGLGRDFRSRLWAPVLNTVQSKIFDRPIREIKDTQPSILSCAVVELEQDMLTVKHEPRAVLDSMTTADKNSALYHHAFYEAPSIRKFGDTYYLIYSSGQNNELCYATSHSPCGDFKYQGVLISNCDLGYKGNRQRLAPAGTIHGSVERIHGEYYVFYHRCTHNTDFSRQACAEKISMNADGTFEQVEITTQGMGEPLPGMGNFPASLCCNLYNRKIKKVQGNGHEQGQPNITHDGKGQYITAIDHGTIIGYKYFVFDGAKMLSVITRKAKGKLIVTTQPGGKAAAVINLAGSDEWQTARSELEVTDGIQALYFTYIGRGKIEFKEFEIS
jgi:hypothetical protein